MGKRAPPQRPSKPPDAPRNNIRTGILVDLHEGDRTDAPASRDATATPGSLKARLQALGLSQAEFARLIEVSPRTVSMWAQGDTPLPGPADAYLRVLSALTPEARSTEYARLKGRANMLDEGIYALDYTADDGGTEQYGNALAVMRNGNILGADRWGGTFHGSYSFDMASQKNAMHIRLRIPPGGELVNGFSAGPEGRILDLHGSLDRATPVTRTRIDIGGKPIDLKLSFLGPLPQ